MNSPTALSRIFSFFLACLLGLTFQAAFAQESDRPERPEPSWDNTIETDGPDFTEASSVIPSGTIQVETALYYFVDKADGVESKTLTYPSTLIRLSLLKSIELRLIGEFVDSRLKARALDAQTESTVKGLAPLLVGTKIFICEEEGLRPEASFIGHLVLPTGSRNFRPDYTASEFRFALSNTLTDRLDLAYNIGYEWDGFSPQGQGIYTLALGYSMSKRWGAYVEVYGEKPEGDEFAHAAAGGIKFLLAPNWQMDISGGHGITEEAIDYYFAYGLRFRLPY